VTGSSKDYVDLLWQCPETDGGSAVVQYIVEKRDVTRVAAAGGGMWMVCGTVSASELSIRVGKLLQGNSYLFRVSAENRVGPGPHTELPEPIVARLPYGTSAQCFNTYSVNNCFDVLLVCIFENNRPMWRHNLLYSTTLWFHSTSTITMLVQWSV